MKKIAIIATAIIFNFQFSIFNSLHAQQPDAIYKQIRYEWTLNADGTSDYHYRHEVQIITNRALTAYADKGETFVVYNPNLEDLTINEVYTLRADGSRVDMPQNAFVYQLPEECADCGRFNHMRELAMVHTGMEYNCTIVVDYTIHRRYNLLYERIPIQRECPVENLEVVVNYNHNDMVLGYKIDGSQYLDLKDVTRTESINTDDMNRTLHYTFKNVQQAPAEAYMPEDIIPTLHLFNGTPEYQESNSNIPTVNLKSVAGKLTKGNNNAFEDICAVRDFVIDAIHLNDIHPSHLGYTHASAADVWQSGCGTATDKAALLASMLNAIGFSARITGENMDEVGVMVDTLEYSLSVRRKTAPEIIGKAEDEIKKFDFETAVDAQLDTLEDGFYRLSVRNSIPEEPSIRAGHLTLTRTTPVASSACDLHSQVTYTLPKGVKLVGGNINRKESFDGVGSVEISVKQSGKKLKVVRNLKLEKSLIPVSDYAQYRQLLTIWQSLDKVLLRSK